MSGLVHRPCYAQHPQNCLHEARSRLWVRTHMRSVACSKCEPVFQSKCLRSIYSSNRSAHGSIHMLKHSKFPIGSFLHDLPAPNLKFGTCSVMFPRECFLQDRPTLAARFSKCGNFIGHKPVCTRMKETAGDVIPSSMCRITIIKARLLLVPIFMWARAGLTSCFLLNVVSHNPKQSDELGRKQCPWQ